MPGPWGSAVTRSADDAAHDAGYIVPDIERCEEAGVNELYPCPRGGGWGPTGHDPTSPPTPPKEVPP